jgi:hypothetical protein
MQAGGAAERLIGRPAPFAQRRHVDLLRVNSAMCRAYAVQTTS